MTINAIELLKQGFLLEATTHQDKLLTLVDRLKPLLITSELIRVGGDQDGGYLIPDDLEDIHACFSPGVADSASFEFDLLERFKIPSHLADFSVNGPPHGFLPKTFTKKFVGAHNDHYTMAMTDWILSCENINNCGDFILQMDIEGAEYVSILGLNLELLSKFRILVIEIHNVYAWASPTFFDVVKSFFDKLLHGFNVLHIHPNNNDGLIHIGQLPAPKTFEITLLRKDRACVVGHSQRFPHPLDRPNSSALPDICLPSEWYVAKTPALEKVPSTERILLCKPQGGLNDVLCSIGKCYRYAEEFDRKLLVDTSTSGLCDDFWQYFEPIDGSHRFSTDLNYSAFDALTCNPKELRGRLATTALEYSFQKHLFVDKKSAQAATFDFCIDHEESILFHGQGWLGPELWSLEILSKLRLTERAKQELLKRLIKLPKTYCAVHIRHTDYTTDYESFLYSLREILAGKNVLICSDNLKIFFEAQKILTDSQIIRISEFVIADQLRLHGRTGIDDYFQLNIDCLADLLGLALSEELYFTNVNEAQRPSGFSLLAKSLHQDRERVLLMLS